MKFPLRQNNRWILVFILCTAAVFGGTARRPAWTPPPSIQGLIDEVPGELVPTLQAPRLDREPEFTKGFTNTVSWPADSIEMNATSSGWMLLFYEIQAQYAFQDSLITLWGFVGAGTDSATFASLPEGFAIAYRLRYYARRSSDEYALSSWSTPQISIQDAHAPILVRWDIIRLQKAAPIAWVIGKTLTFRVTASDPPAGKIMEIVVHEKSESVDDTVIFDIVPPKPDVDTVFSSYSLKTPDHKPVTLTLWIRDFSSQPSSSASMDLFWMPEEENQMFSFPNPFNPSIQETAVIQVPTPETKTAKVFDPFGNCVRILHKADPSSAFYEWDGRNERGGLVANGGYLCVIEGNPKLYCKIAVLR
jgi:hypothetical protein